jgi:hypothetical protein
LQQDHLLPSFRPAQFPYLPAQHQQSQELLTRFRDGTQENILAWQESFFNQTFNSKRVAPVLPFQQLAEQNRCSELIAVMEKAVKM